MAKFYIRAVYVDKMDNTFIPRHTMSSKLKFNGKLATSSRQSLFPLKMSNFGGHELRATAFTFKPYSEVNFESQEFAGIEYNIAYEAAKSLNLLMKVIPTSGK